MGIVSTLLVASGVVFFIASRVATPDKDFRKGDGGSSGGSGKARASGDGLRGEGDLGVDPRVEAIETPFLDPMRAGSSSTDGAEDHGVV